MCHLSVVKKVIYAISDLLGPRHPPPSEGGSRRIWESVAGNGGDGEQPASSSLEGKEAFPSDVSSVRVLPDCTQICLRGDWSARWFDPPFHNSPIFLIGAPSLLIWCGWGSTNLPFNFCGPSILFATQIVSASGPGQSVSVSGGPTLCQCSQT